jgi:hypothetical protein
MAKDIKFPSPANQNKRKEEKMEAPKEVVGVPVALFRLEYFGKHVQFLDHVHSLAPGINSIPFEVWEKVKSYPAIVSLVEGGFIKEIGKET